jgi:cytochrome c biogenesis protein CcmG, thiol:disulfide interchange protein DsbE
MRKGQNRNRWVLVILLALMALSCSQRQRQPKIGDRFPYNELYDLKGKKVTLPDDFNGRILIIRFWQDCCSYDINEMSSVDQIFEKFEEKGISVVTVHTGKPRKDAEGFVAMLKIRYPVLLDSGSAAANRCGVSVFPATFILDRNGIVQAKMIGAGKRDYEKLVRAFF